MTEYQLDKALRQAAVEFVKRKPIQALLLAFPKLWYLYHEDVSAIYHNTASPSRATPQWIWTAFRWQAQIFYMAMMAAALLSAKSLRKLKDYRHTLLVGLVILYWTGIHMVFFGSGRFHLPILPLIFLFSSFTLLAAFDRQVRPLLDISK